MDSAKQEVQQILDSLPDGATLEEIQYRIYVRQAISAGIRDLDADRTVSHAEVEQRMSKWTGR